LLKVAGIDGVDFVSRDNVAGSSWYAVAVAAGLGAAVTANGRVRLFSSWLYGVLRDAADVGGFGESVLCDANHLSGNDDSRRMAGLIFWLNP